MGETTGAAPAPGRQDAPAPETAEGPAPQSADGTDVSPAAAGGAAAGGSVPGAPAGAESGGTAASHGTASAVAPGDGALNGSVPDAPAAAASDGAAPEAAPGAGDGDGTAEDAAEGRGAADAHGDGEPDEGEEAGRSASRRPPAVTLDTARPEGGGRAAPGDAPAPARQWPLLTVLGMTAAGLLIVGTDAFTDAVRIGIILIGAALLTGAVLRRVMPSVGMLAVRSRFTDMVTYGLLGTAIVLLALVAQPKPWLDIPIIEEAVHFTVR
ncbi:DUF3017 domain-containing protein [Streptomyces zhihengii]